MLHHFLTDLNRIRYMTSITILWAVIVRLYYLSTRTPEIEPPGTTPISIRRSDRPPRPNLLQMRIMLPSSQRHCPRQFLICFHTIFWYLPDPVFCSSGLILWGDIGGAEHISGWPCDWCINWAVPWQLGVPSFVALLHQHTITGTFAWILGGM